jgi:hypothetical protein
LYPYVRDLLLAMLAWLCGKWAVKYVSAFPQLDYDRFSDVFTLLLFQPIGLLLSGVMFATSSYLLYTLLTENGKQLGTTRSSTNRLLHGLVVLFALYIAVIQFMKTPIATSVVIVLIVGTKLYQLLRRRVLQADIGKWTDEK